MSEDRKMEFGAEQVEIVLHRQKSGQTSLMPEQTQDGGYNFQKEGLLARVTLETKKICVLGRIQIKLKDEAFRENDHLALEEPVTVRFFPKPQPLAMTALYLWRDWWTRPAFVKSWEELPKRTQCIYLKYEDRYGCLMLLAGKEAKTMARGGEKGQLCLELAAYCSGLSEIREPLFVWAEGSTVYEAVHICAQAAAEEAGVPTKEKRNYPEMFEKLGWCSWDAFHTDISEENVLLKAKELREKRVPVRWMLMDDGWQSVREQRMYDFGPDRKKFPNGFSRMIAELKEKSGVEQVGVWHAFGGYWGGIEPESSVHNQERENLYRTRTGKLLPYPDAGRGYRFYQDWYRLLRLEGIDFVKVDGQSAVKNYFENEMPVCWAAGQLHKALEGAASVYMGGEMINCMGMGMENILGRPSSALSRNSDDFVPEDQGSFVEHMLQNAYNAVYHDEFYYCDWDMFWTCHPDAGKHALLRAVSGGPVYFSDRIGDTDPAVLSPLVRRDGRILRMNRAAKPTADCLFVSPREKGLLCLTNTAGCGRKGYEGGALALYNLGEAVLERILSPSDIYDLPVGRYFCYNWKTGAGKVLEYEEGMSLWAAPQDTALCLFVPLTPEGAVIGMVEKYISFLAVEQWGAIENGFWALIEEGGVFAFYSSRKVKSCFADGKDCGSLLEEKDGLYRLHCDGEGERLVIVTYEG